MEMCIGARKVYVDIEENTTQMMYAVFTFFVENVNYFNFSHILYRCGLKNFS